MESAGGLDCRWFLAANWTVSGGSLANSVTVESSDSPIDEAALSSAPRSPLVLFPPPSADPTPCEITINFPQRYEVRQVYVRSTSRVYEIYYCPKPLGDNDYLCTVRCSVAAKSEAPSMCCTGESSSVSLRGSNEGLEEERCRDDNSNSNDDEWVQVKAPNSPALTDPAVTNGRTSFPLKNYMTMDLYEATAEISDAEPCISLTLRLLSVQSGSRIYVDEVYVFVDPVDPNSEIQEFKAENSAGSSLMSMLVPSLLQLSKSKGTSRLPDRVSSDSSDHQKQARTGQEVTKLDNLSKESESTSFLKVNEQEVKSEVANAEPVHPIVKPAHQASQDPCIEKKPDAPSSRIETVLEQLVSRVSRIEDLFMRFEENMLKPISNIEARMQHVEQQLEALNEKTLNSGERSCKRFSAPECSLSDSNFNSLYGNESEYHDRGELEPDKKDSSDKLPIPSEDDESGSESAGQLLSCLTITAPGFSHGEDEDEQSPEAVKQAVADSPTAKRHVSIDDALASALAGFLSSTSLRPQNYSQSLVMRAPEFSNEDENGDENASPRGHLDAATGSSFCLNVSDEMNFPEIAHSGSTNDEEKFEEITKGSNGPSLHMIVSENEDDEPRTETTSIPVPDESEASDELLQTEIKSSSDIVEEEPANAANADVTAGEVPKKDPEEDILHDVLALSQNACPLDFETLILDVKFASQQNVTSKSLLEALLGNSPGSDIAVPSNEGTLEASSSQDQSNFIEVDDANRPDIGASSCLAVDLEYCSLQEVLVNPGSEEQQDSACSYEEVSAGSLI